jgi:L,D-peptidoglycan transpeptidase YkuD (ErfK/YbiS/YcfS/YnhG family)
MRALKREGDGATPIGRWQARRLMFRRDRGLPPRTGLVLRRLQPRDGWCDAPHDPNYNRPVLHPYPASAEAMWRDDQLYDLVLVLSHNERPRLRGGGSAIFVHVARAGYEPTAGCIALAPRDLRLLLTRINGSTWFDVR